MHKNLIKKSVFVTLFLSTLCLQSYASKFISDTDLWKHVVTIDRLTWEEREGVKKVNKSVDEMNFVRRAYLDITGKIPTYEQLAGYVKSKTVNKRKELIDQLLTSPGYVAHFSNFWLDLLRNPYGDPQDFNHNEFTRYIERSLSENRTYDKIVYDLITAEGPAQTNPAIAFYHRDRGTNPMDTTNALVRAFLGTRIGCAQCHNHRFDKWTQKEFYETAAFFHGVRLTSTMGRREDVFNFHKGKLKEHERYNKELFGAYSNRILNPTIAAYRYDNKRTLTYPDNYVYDNAKPNSAVKERIVFDYGDQEVTGNNKPEIFAKWLTSKENPMFSKIMANRLWKRVMGVSLLEPIDDWKDNITVQNPRLFEALGKIFVDVNYDLKAFLSVIYNSEAYQYASDIKNEIKQDDYKVQGAIMKRMSAQQISDSLLTLKHGNLDQYAKLDGAYFEIEDKINELSVEFMNKLKPMMNTYKKKYGRDAQKYTAIDNNIQDLIFDHLEKVQELREYYDIGNNGYLKSYPSNGQGIAKNSSAKKGSEMMAMAVNTGGSMMQDSGKMKTIHRAHMSNNDFRNVFGAQDRSAPETNLETGATMKQILKMMNSKECHDVVNPKSFLMKNTLAQTKLKERLLYLYYSIYGRVPSSKDYRIAEAFFLKGNDDKRWSKYALALLNSPEFYFIK